MPAALARRRLERCVRTQKPLVIGPWLSEVGFELLYWIPLLRRLRHSHSVWPARTIVISRGGVEAWYADLHAEYVDAYDVLERQEFEDRLRFQVSHTGSQKQTSITDLDREILARVAELKGVSRYELVHPSLMYRRFRPTWTERRPVRSITEELEHQPLRAGDVSLSLDRPYVAVKLYFSSALPDTPGARTTLEHFIARLADRVTVVALSTGLETDLHPEFGTAGLSRVIDLRDSLPPRRNLGLQTQIIEGAEALVCTYGGFSYLGPIVGVPTFALYALDNFNPVHLEVARDAIRRLRGHGPRSGGLFPLSLGSLELLDRLAGPP